MKVSNRVQLEFDKTTHPFLLHLEKAAFHKTIIVIKIADVLLLCEVKVYLEIRSLA
jgi:hypothetical protein